MIIYISCQRKLPVLPCVTLVWAIGLRQIANSSCNIPSSSMLLVPGVLNARQYIPRDACCIASAMASRYIPKDVPVLNALIHLFKFGHEK